MDRKLQETDEWPQRCCSNRRGRLTAPRTVHVPVDVDVQKIRKKLNLTQAEFAHRYGFSLGSIRDWEQKRKQPEASARMFLKVIEKRPEVVAEVLGRK